MNVIILGSSSFVGHYIYRDLSNADWVVHKRSITNNHKDWVAFIKEFKPNLVIDCRWDYLNNKSYSQSLVALFRSISNEMIDFKYCFMSSISEENDTDYGLSKRFVCAYLKENHPVNSFSITLPHILSDGDRFNYSSFLHKLCYEIYYDSAIQFENNVLPVISSNNLASIVVSSVYSFSSCSYPIKYIDLQLFRENAKLLLDREDRNAISFKDFVRIVHDYYFGVQSHV